MAEQAEQTPTSTLMRSYKMTIENITTPEGVEIVNITHEDGTFTSMTKEAYEAQQAEQSTPMVADE